MKTKTKLIQVLLDDHKVLLDFFFTLVPLRRKLFYRFYHAMDYVVTYLLQGTANNIIDHQIRNLQLHTDFLFLMIQQIAEVPKQLMDNFTLAVIPEKPGDIVENLATNGSDEGVNGEDTSFNDGNNFLIVEMTLDHPESEIILLAQKFTN